MSKYLFILFYIGFPSLTFVSLQTGVKEHFLFACVSLILGVYFQIRHHERLLTK